MSYLSSHPGKQRRNRKQKPVNNPPVKTSQHLPWPLNSPPLLELTFKVISNEHNVLSISFTFLRMAQFFLHFTYALWISLIKTHVFRLCIKMTQTTWSLLLCHLEQPFLFAAVPLEMLCMLCLPGLTSRLLYSALPSASPPQASPQCSEIPFAKVTRDLVWPQTVKNVLCSLTGLVS